MQPTIEYVQANKEMYQAYILSGEVTGTIGFADEINTSIVTDFFVHINSAPVALISLSECDWDVNAVVIDYFEVFTSMRLQGIGTCIVKNIQQMNEVKTIDLIPKSQSSFIFWSKNGFQKYYCGDELRLKWSKE